MHNEERKQQGIDILSQMGIEHPEFLGEGHQGVVFHDQNNVYKVHIPFIRGNNDEIIRRLSYFKNIEQSAHLYQIKTLEINGTIVEIYKYEKGDKIITFSESDAISILTELWCNKIIVKDCKPHNCIVVDGVVKIIDYDGCAYNDNLFLNLCVRLYLYVEYYTKLTYDDFIKLQRSAINNFDLFELQGAREFINKVFGNIIYKESLSYTTSLKITNNSNSEEYTINTLPNLEQLFFKKLKARKYLSGIEIEDIRLNRNLYFEPHKIQVSYHNLQPIQDKVTLLIKTCAQDVATVKENIKHIVKQLSAPNPFFEIVVSIDTKEQDFLREYNSNPSLQDLIDIVKQLVEYQVIDRYIIYDNNLTEEINKRWFNLNCKESHSVKNIPVSSQLYAFEQCKGDYILQCDCDILVGRRDYSHSFLTDIISELKKNDKVIFVGFNIYNKESKDYFGFENGGFVPEVRFGLFDKERFFSLRPFPNELSSDGKLMLSWYRAVEQYQNQTGYCSIRGGDYRSFYIHPQNYRKKEPYAWMTILDKVEQNIIPEQQLGCFDVEGSLYDWCIPKRNEKMVVVSVFRNVSIERFLRFWCSLMSQSFQDFGVVLYDDCSDNGLQFFIEKLIAPLKNKITFIKGRYRDERMANEYRCIHYFCENPQSIIVMIDGDDALIGKDVLNSVYHKYEFSNAEITVGKVHQTYRLQPHYRYPVNFCQPRDNNGGNVWQHLKTFKKYLFDSIPIINFKHILDYQKISKNKWFETCDDFAMMIPMVEMCKRAVQMDFINYFYERDYDNRNADRALKEKCIAEILQKPQLSTNNVFVGRKTFRPDFKHIEIDITYDCNLKCAGCNRSCAQAPTKEQISIADIENFIQESIDSGLQWKQINVLGGEPTLHKEFMNILKLLQEYANEYSPDTVIKVVSNGITQESRDLCDLAQKEFKNVIIDYASYKKNNKIDYFAPFNDAPIDDPNFKGADFTKACWVTSYCGIGLTSRGYYACAVCGGIDRVLNGHNGATKFSELTEEKLKEHYNQNCRFCGIFKSNSNNAGDFIPRYEKEPFRNIVSKSWLDIYGRNGF